jgi:hypothetical protein
LQSENIPAANRDLAHLVGTGYHLCLVTGLDKMLQVIADDLAVVLKVSGIRLHQFTGNDDQCGVGCGSTSEQWHVSCSTNQRRIPKSGQTPLKEMGHVQ